MTTFSYSVKHWEIESHLASALTTAEFRKVARSLNTRAPAVDLPETDVSPAVKYAGGLLADAPERVVERVQLACVISGPRLKLKDKVAARSFAAFLTTYRERPYVTGLQGVYAAYTRLRQDASAMPSGAASRAAKWVATVSACAGYGVVDAGNLSAPHTAAKMSLVRDAVPTLIETSLQMVQGAKRLKSARHATVLKRFLGAAEFPATEEWAKDVGRRVRAAGKSLLPQWLSAAVMVHNCVLMPTDYGVALLTTGDLVRLEQLVASEFNMTLALVVDALGQGKSPENTLSFIRAEMDRMTAGGAQVPEPETVGVCKAYKQAFSVAMAAHSGDTGCLDAHWAELLAMPNVEVSGALVFAEQLVKMGIQDVMNLGKVYKVLPMQSSAASSTLYARMLKSTPGNPMVPIEEGRPAMDDKLFEKCLRDEYTVALRNRAKESVTKLKVGVAAPSWWDAWVDRGDQPDAPGWSEIIDLRGAAPIVVRSDLSPKNFRDSALAPDEDPVDARDQPTREKANMLLRRILDTSYPTQKEAADALLSTLKRVQKGDQKPENFKDPLRLFLEAKLVDRIGMSWIEECVHSVAKHHPCYMVGKGPRDIEAKMHAMVGPAAAGEALRLLSYDLSDWSPGMRARCQEASGALLAEIFDDPRMGRSYACQKEATVYVLKNGEFASFESPEANFEGQDGKAMTMLHLGLMSATIARTRQVTSRKDIQVQLATFIDDGLAALVAPKRAIAALFAEFQKCTEEVYAYYGYKLAARKCFPSDRLGTFLSEVYYAGVHVVSITKAALRIAAEPKEAHDTLPDRMAKVVGGAQGAVAAGMPPLTATLFAHALCALELMDWDTDQRKMMERPPQLIAYMLLCPVAYGGFGLPHFANIAKTGRGTPLAEGVVVMQSFAHAYPELAALTVRLLRTPLPRRSAAAQLRNPLGMSGLSCFVNTRVQNALSAVLPTVAQNDMVRALFAAAAAFDLEAYAEAILGRVETIHALTIRLAWRASPAALPEAFISKFESGRTMAKVLGMPKMASISRLNRSDAMSAFAAFK